MNRSLIVLDDLSIGYDGRPLLTGISLSIDRNSFTGILGANGSGKSTLLKTILGLFPPVAGRIIVPEGATPTFGYVPQSIHFDPVYLFTAFDVALMGVYGRVRPGHFISSAERALVHECLRAAGAEEFSRKRFSELSGGQKQRVLIARALAAQPDVLVLDEPTAGVDHATTHAVLEFISELRKSRRITVLLVTHDFGAVRQYAGHVIWLHEDTAFYGTTKELLAPDRIAQILEMGIG